MANPKARPTPPEEMPEKPSDERNNVDEVIVRKELLRIIDEAIDRLPEKPRLVILYRYKMDMSNKEIAKTMGFSAARASALYAKAISLLEQDPGVVKIREEDDVK